jgi:hypothetical protein
MKRVEGIWAELSAKKVELSVIGDLKNLSDEAKDLQNDLNRSEQDMKDVLDSMSNIGMQAGEELDYAEKLDDDLEAAIRKAEAAAKDLGIDSVPDIDDAVDRRSSLRRAFNDAYALYKKLDF